MRRQREVSENEEARSDETTQSTEKRVAEKHTRTEGSDTEMERKGKEVSTS